MSSFDSLFSAAKSRVEETDADEVSRLAETGDAKIVDVREKTEWDEGHIPGAVHVPRGYLELRIENVVRDKDEPVVLYCAGGTRSVLAARTLQDMGYTNVRSMAGGFSSWKDVGLPAVKPRTLTSEQLARYSRHVLIQEVGEEGQLKLLDAKVLLVGAGGLGSPTALYLAAAGVGTIGIVDSDVVDESNLQRQVLHTTERIGMLKVDSARQTLHDLNPEVDVLTFNTRLVQENVDDIVAQFDIVVDGTDNFDTRYMINETCVVHHKPNVSASILSFDGQLSVFDPPAGPCYKCVYPEPPPPSLAPT